MTTVKFQTPQKALLFSLVVLFFLALAVVMMFWQGERAVAYFWQDKALEKNLDLDTRLDYMLKAANLERRDDGFWRNLSQLFLAKAVEIGQQRPSSDQQKNRQALKRLRQMSQNAIAAARNGKDLDPQNAANWVNLGDVYRGLIPFGQGAADQAISAYNKALDLDPQNPSLHLQKARAKFAQAQRASTQVRALLSNKNQLSGKKRQAQVKQLNKQINKILTEAEEFAKKATELKPNYASAHLFLTNVYDAQGKTDQAIKRLSNVVILNPRNAGLYFQLGLLYYKKDDLDRAQASFEQAIAISKDYANARYFLGLVYSRQNKKDKAIKQFEKIAETNPDNKEVKTIIANLKAGKPPLEGIAPPASKPAKREQAPVGDRGTLQK